MLELPSTPPLLLRDSDGKACYAGTSFHHRRKEGLRLDSKPSKKGVEGSCLLLEPSKFLFKLPNRTK
jgi:hypothetical protein